jgi:RNA polymerase sigma-70 factor (ECF subfamily)
LAITDLDEQLLVRAHQAGDEHAFGQIVRSQHRALYAHAYKRLGNHEAAEDAVQDTLLRAYRAMPSFDGDLRLRAWLHRILTNVCHDESNRLRRQIGLIDKLEAQPLEVVPDPIEETVLHDTVRIMNSALAELPESYREALVLRYVDGLSFRDVAETIGTTEENARARVHRGRLALHKVLSRVSVMVAFLVPGLRRTQKALDGTDTAIASGATEHSVSLSTQLASHMVNAAPVLNRVAAEGSTFVAAKTSVVATAVAAVAAVAAPVAAYRVYDTAQSPQTPPPAVASPAKEEPPAVTTTTVLSSSVTAGVAGPSLNPSTSTSSTAPTSSTIPPSALTPFAPTDRDDDDATTTTTTPPTTVAPPAEPEPTTTVHGSVGGDTFAVSGARPDFSVTGGSVLQGDGAEPHSGRLDGDVYVADAIGGDANAELTLTLDDGRVLRVRFRGTLQSEEVTEASTRWTMTGAYAIEGAEQVGVAERGTATLVFQHVNGAPSSLRFELQGQQAQPS